MLWLNLQDSDMLRNNRKALLIAEPLSPPLPSRYGALESRSLGALGGIGENHETLQIMANAGNDAFGDKLSKKNSFHKDIS